MTVKETSNLIGWPTKRTPSDVKTSFQPSTQVLHSKIKFSRRKCGWICRPTWYVTESPVYPRMIQNHKRSGFVVMPIIGYTCFRVNAKYILLNSNMRYHQTIAYTSCSKSLPHERPKQTSERQIPRFGTGIIHRLHYSKFIFQFQS